MKVRRAERLVALERQLLEIVDRAEALEERYRVHLDQLHPEQARSGLNLLHYLALRQRDARALQDELAAFGLSSLGRSEAHVLTSVHAVLHAIHALQGRSAKRRKGPVSFKQGRQLLKERTRALLGRKAKGGAARIMVTLPVEAADDPAMVREILEAGMDCARINCAQGGPDDWERILANLRRGEKLTRRSCRVFMDLGGPKIRTGDLVPGPRILSLKSRKDVRGRVVEPAIAILVDGDRARGPSPGGPPTIPVPGALLRVLRPGDRLSFGDTRGLAARLEVTSVGEGGATVASPTSAYLETGTPLTLEGRSPPLTVPVGLLPPVEDPIVLRPGDVLLLHKDPRPGEPAVPAADGAPGRPAHVACSPPEVLDDVRAGEPIVLDDGKARGVVRRLGDGELEVEIVTAPPEGMRLRGSKGINLPETRLRRRGLTPQDKEDLRFVAAHADGVNVSFVHHPDDVEEVLDELDAAGGDHLGLILKIETRQGFQHLPGILLAAMERPAVGVMIARGDLAAEVGWTHMAQVQEEILRVCEAAHVPVVWATEVLDRLAKKGIPTRSEISDVAMAERAECVMLNKGPHIVAAIRTLDELLRSLQAYQRKKTTLLPALTLDPPDLREAGRRRGVGARRAPSPAP